MSVEDKNPLEAPRIPPPPPRPERGRRQGDPRWLVWVASLGLGIVLGAVGYLWVPRLAVYFDYWLALALG
jgi:hypothetical protein